MTPRVVRVYPGDVLKIFFPGFPYRESYGCEPGQGFREVVVPDGARAFVWIARPPGEQVESGPIDKEKLRDDLIRLADALENLRLCVAGQDVVAVVVKSRLYHLLRRAAMDFDYNLGICRSPADYEPLRIAGGLLVQEEKTEPPIDKQPPIFVGFH